MDKDIKPALKFYKIEKSYIDFLYTKDKEKNGYSCVPTLDYKNTQKEKFMCGIVLKVGDFDYFAPVSSYRKQQNDNVLLCDKQENVTSSIRLNFMIPAPKEVCKEYDFSKEVEPRYRSVVRQELLSANAQVKNILRQANNTYYTVRNMVTNGKAPRWACNFPYLEYLCREWENGVKKQNRNEEAEENIIVEVAATLVE